MSAEPAKTRTIEEQGAVAKAFTAGVMYGVTAVAEKMRLSTTRRNVLIKHAVASVQKDMAAQKVDTDGKV